VKKFIFLAMASAVMFGGIQAEPKNDKNAASSQPTVNTVIHSTKYFWKAILPIRQLYEKNLLDYDEQKKPDWKAVPGEKKISWPMLIAILLSFAAALLYGLKKRYGNDSKLIITGIVMVAIAAQLIMGAILGNFVLSYFSLGEGMNIALNALMLILTLFYFYMLWRVEDKNLSLKMVFFCSLLALACIALLTKSWRAGVILAAIEIIVFFVAKYLNVGGNKNSNLSRGEDP
jgi:hypothetical protein